MSKRTVPKDIVTVAGVRYRVKKSFAIPTKWTDAIVKELVAQRYIERLDE